MDRPANMTFRLKYLNLTESTGTVTLFDLNYLTFQLQAHVPYWGSVLQTRCPRSVLSNGKHMLVNWKYVWKTMDRSWERRWIVCASFVHLIRRLVAPVIQKKSTFETKRYMFVPLIDNFPSLPSLFLGRKRMWCTFLVWNMDESRLSDSRPLREALKALLVASCSVWPH